VEKKPRQQALFFKIGATIASNCSEKLSRQKLTL